MHGQLPGASSDDCQFIKGKYTNYSISICINMGNPAVHCARIMAVADVFDAISAKRCYRDALPLEECYKIIEQGRGEDFDPDVVDAFMMNKNKIEEVYFGVPHCK